jgi:tRNA threonylcarbamoyladenosine biosynthesis protein TsaE
MNLNSIRKWKKVYEPDLGYIAYELKDMVDAPAVVILKGEMGSGKTTFSKVFVHETDPRYKTLSPSYSVLSETPNILHGDFYRLKTADEIIHLELELYLEDKRFFLVEWGEKYIYALSREVPEDYSFYQLDISINDVTDDKKEQSRNFELFSITL